MTKISNQYSLTNVLFADTTNGRVGVNNGSPTVALDVTGAGKFSSSLTAAGLSSPEKTSAIYGINVATSSGSGGNLTIKAGNGSGAGNTSGNLYLAFGRGGASASSGAMYFGVAQATDAVGLDATYMTLTSAGNVGIGTTSPAKKLSINEGSGTTLHSIKMSSSTNAANGYIGMWYGQLRLTVGTTYDTTNGWVADSSASAPAQIYLNSSNGYSYITFDTVASNTSTPIERMRIEAGGDVLVGTTTSQMSAANRGLIAVNGSGTVAVHFMVGGADKGFLYHNGGDFYWKANGAGNYLYAVAVTNGVYLSTNATSWTANSDERIKDINSQITDAVTTINSLRAVKYSWKSDKTKKLNIGLVAQDVQAVLPEIVDVQKDEMGTLGVRYTEMIPVLVAAIKELSADLTSAKQEIELLKAK